MGLQAQPPSCPSQPDRPRPGHRWPGDLVHPRPDPGPPPVGCLAGRYQAWLFFPMLLLEGLHLHIASVRALLGRSGKARWAEAGLLAVHIGGYLTAVFVVLSPLAGGGVPRCPAGPCSGSTWDPSSPPTTKGMPVVDQDRRSISCAARSSPHATFAAACSPTSPLAGLNYQIEHHLFPSMPRPSARHAQAPVRAFCAQHGIPYTQTGLLASYAQVLRRLHTTGRSAGPEPAADTAAAGPDAAPEPGHA